MLRKRKREREKNISARETSTGCLSYASPPGIKPDTYVCAMTGDLTCSLLVHGTMLQPTEPPGHGHDLFFTKNILASIWRMEAERPVCGREGASTIVVKWKGENRKIQDVIGSNTDGLKVEGKGERSNGGVF